MSKDVEKALLEVIAEQGAMDATAAAKYLEQCKKEGRYQKDVY
jgi:sulfite reductase (NADPH) flavoprotein alpha-component